MFLHSTYFLMFPILILICTIAIQRNHLLMILLTLEAISLLIITSVALSSNPLSNHTPFLIMFILTMAATEASLGLGLLVTLTRQSGNDNTNNLVLLKC